MPWKWLAREADGERLHIAEHAGSIAATLDRRGMKFLMLCLYPMPSTSPHPHPLATAPSLISSQTFTHSRSKTGVQPPIILRIANFINLCFIDSPISSFISYLRKRLPITLPSVSPTAFLTDGNSLSAARSSASCCPRTQAIWHAVRTAAIPIAE